MSEALVLAPPVKRASAVPSLSAEVARIAHRLADFVDGLSGGPELTGSAAFLRSLAAAYAHDDRAEPPALERLATALRPSRLELDLLLLAGLPDEHEGVASVLACLHAGGQPRASVGLSAQLLCGTLAERATLRRALESGPLARVGALALSGEGPFFNRTLELAPSLWSVLRGVDAWPHRLVPERPPAGAAGLEEWLSDAACARALAALAAGERCVILLHGEDLPACAARAGALAARSGVDALLLDDAALAAPGLVAHLAARGSVPVVELAPATSGAARLDPLDRLERLPGPVLACAQPGAARPGGSRPAVPVPVGPLGARARVRVWRAALPALADEAERLAAAYAVEPARAAALAEDAQLTARLDRRLPTADDVASAVRARAHVAAGAAVALRRPTAGWDALVLPPDRMRMLRETLDRLTGQGRVLDQWGFLAGRPGARGVRVLLAGPPGTGKTLAAEVLASALGVDMLVVDLAKLVSKWLGDTEKHLAEVFDAAEHSHALLLFDEADALFGRRTEVSDAHDRYANLETAYLLSRLERFEGLAALSTNLKRNIDPAFLRRLEFVIELEEPPLDARVELWRRHLPARAPLAPDVDLTELAALYPMVGGLIRNAAVAAGFLAAAAGTEITRSHLVHAVRREFQKAGRAFPGLPPDLTDRKEA